MNENEIRENLEDTISMEPVAPEAAEAPKTKLEDTQEFDLEDIIKEFGSAPVVTEEPAAEAAEEAAEEAEEAPVEEPVEEPAQEPAVTGDTIRLDAIHVESEPQEVPGAEHIDDEVELKPEAFSGQWEPEYEQPMGEYVPPQPIQFRPRSRIRELKRQLVAGPEKRYYELAEKGLGKLQLSIFLSFLIVLFSTAVTVFYQLGHIPEERLKLMVFLQFFVLLLSALLGCQQMIDGVADIFKGRFTLNTMLTVTFIVCCADGVFGLMQTRIPCCAAFSLQVTMALWSAYHRRHGEMGQMDVLRKAIRLDAVQVCSDYHDGRKGLLRADGELDHFMDHYNAPSPAEKVTCWYALIATVISLGLGVAAYMLRGSISNAVSVASVCLLAAAPAAIFIAYSRPAALLYKRLYNVGTVLCGWQGVKALGGKSVFPVEYSDLFPVGAARMNGVKFFGSRPTDEVVAYGTAMIVANGSGLAPLFQQVLDSRNGYHYDAENIQCFDGGISGEVKGESVLVGSMAFLKEMGVEIPNGMRVNQAVCVAIEGELAGLFALNYENARSATVGLSVLGTNRGAYPIFVTDDFLLCSDFIQSRFGLRPRKMRFVSAEVREQLRQKQPDEGKPAALLSTREGLVSYGYGIAGSRALRTAVTLGTIVQIAGGLLGLAAMAILVLLGRLDLLTPANLFAYQLVWMIPGVLISEWTRVI